MLFSCYGGDKKAERILRMTGIRDQLMIELGAEYNLILPRPDSLQIMQGKDLYMKLCASCHGESGQGNGWFSRDLKIPPTDFTDQKIATFFSESGRLQIIRKGIEDTSMKNWEMVLNEAEILAVYLYVRSLIITKTADEILK
jgi:mono/diheme cytochrome c family protein